MIFGRRHRPDRVEKAILELAVDGFRRAGVSVTVDHGEAGFELSVAEPDAVLALHNLTETARTTARAEWPELVDWYVRSQLDVLAQPELKDLSVDDLRRQIRVQLISAEARPDDDLAYARPFAPGIRSVLCLDTPTAVSTLTTDALADLPLGLDELYAQGQANTDAEPTDDEDAIDHLVRTLEGESFFIAAKAANFAALTSTVIGPAPLGVVFALPNRHLLLYAIADQADGMEAAVAVTEVAAAVCSDEEFDHPGGIISSSSYYCAPDGTVELLGGEQHEIDGEPALSIRPGDAFIRHLPLERHD